MTHADRTWLAFLAALIATDAIYVKTRRPLLTQSAREHKVLAFTVMGLFGLHVLDVLGPCDPFRVFGLATRAGAGN